MSLNKTLLYHENALKYFQYDPKDNVLIFHDLYIYVTHSGVLRMRVLEFEVATRSPYLYELATRDPQSSINS